MCVGVCVCAPALENARERGVKSLCKSLISNGDDFQILELEKKQLKWRLGMMGLCSLVSKEWSLSVECI